MRELPIRFADCTWEEVASLARDAVLILPVGSTEPHGPHLPLATDVIISEGMALRAARMLRERALASLVLPPIFYSVTDFAAGFAGAVSIGFDTARAVLVDVVTSLAGQGFCRFCVANSHLEPAHVDSIAAAVTQASEATGVAIAFPDKRRRRWAARLGEEFLSGACHAGRYESSLVMAERPELVDDAVRRDLPDVPISLSEAIRDGRATFREAGGDRAYFGQPAAASSEEGEALYAALARMLLISIRETYQLDERLSDID